jgi:hypothetical protein
MRFGSRQSTRGGGMINTPSGFTEGTKQRSKKILGSFSIGSSRSRKSPNLEIQKFISSLATSIDESEAIWHSSIEEKD